jgi:CRP-like cAMP-binding protein
MERNSQSSLPGTVEQASGGSLSLQPKPPSAQSGAPGPRSRTLAKESDALPGELADTPTGQARADKAEGAAEPTKTVGVLASWGRARKKTKAHSLLSKGLESAREMNRVMDYDSNPVETHGRSSWGKSDEKWVVLPDSRFRKIWDVFQVVFLFYVAIMTPLRIGFNIEVDGPGPDSTASVTWCFELVVDLYFITDIFINFRTAFEASDRFVERRVDAIKWHYIKSWFFIDLVACLPINYVWLIVKASQGSTGGADGNANLKVIKIIRLLRLAKLLRLARLKRILKVYEEEFHGIISSCKLLSLFLFMVYVSHVIACFWYMFGAENQTNSCYVPETEGQACSGVVKGWVDAEFADSSIGQTAEMVPLSRRYLKSFYWAITTLSTVGYGDITPNTDAEMGYACFAELLGSMIFGIMIGSLSTMLMSGKALEEKIDNQLAELQEFMTSKNIPSKLRSKVRRYMELYYEKKSSYDEKAVLNSLPPVLAQELMEAMYKDIVDTVPLFAGLDTEIISKLCVTLRPYQALADEYVYKQGEIGKELYIILHGRVEMSRDLHRLGVLGAGSFFGDEVVRRDKSMGTGAETRPIKRERSAKAIENCDLAFLTKQDVAVVARDYPTMEVRLRNLANRRAQKDAILLKRMVADKQAKDEAEANDRFDKISTVSALFARPLDGVIDPHRMEQYQAALTIQKHVRGHQARAGGGGIMRKKLINSVLTVDSMNAGLPAVCCKLMPGDGKLVDRQAGAVKVLSEEVGGGLDHTVIGWFPDDGTEPTLVKLGDLRAITFGYGSRAFKAMIESSEAEGLSHKLQPEWRCFSLLYDGALTNKMASLSDEHRASSPVVDPINLGNVENIVGQSADDVGRPTEFAMSFEIRQEEEDAIGMDSLCVEWLTALDRMATEQLTGSGQQLYRGIDALKPKSAADKASEIDAAFNAVDTNGDGMLDESELRLLLSSLDEPATDAAIASLINAISGEDGNIGKHEFQQWMAARSVRKATEQATIAVQFLDITSDHPLLQYW